METTSTPVVSSSFRLSRSAATWMVSGAAGILGLSGAGLGVLGLTLVADDYSSRGEMLDGLGAAIGIAAGLIGAVLLAVAVTVVWLAGRHPRAAGLGTGAFGTLVALTSGTQLGGLGLSVSSVALLAGVVVAGLGFTAAAGTRTVRIDSPGGDQR